ncbi:DUF1778 domain-containing protein [Mesorhizobium sp. M1328]|uniref:type II toxin-antitoxin system TacA family antitoxin n=1 Tax=Mesorhizobium sp. M1328 TaxID=2957082 RepID=UPI0033369724
MRHRDFRSKFERRRRYFACSRRIGYRVKAEERSLINRAKARGKNRTDFVLDATLIAAEEALLDQAIIAASPDAFAAFLARLDMPTEPNER